MKKYHGCAFLLFAVPLFVPQAARAATAAESCEKTVSSRLRTCIKAISKQTLACYQATGTTCGPGDTKIADALAAVSAKVLDKCPDATTLTAVGYPATLTPASLVTRLQEACTSAVASLEARSYGGPHAAVRTANVAARPCLDLAFATGGKLIDKAFSTQSTCVLNTHKGKTCDPAKVAEKVAKSAAATVTKIHKTCAALQNVVAVTPETFADRATAQATCLVPTAHALTAPLTLACGPRAAVPVPARGTNTQIVLDSATWGTKCGDGSDYAFWLRLAPTGAPLEKVVVYLQGGGVCYDNTTCTAQSPDLFEALSDGMVQSGVLSSTAATNPFRDWTKVYLPYCTQDLFIGGGTTSAYSSMTVQRYGAPNTRATLRYVRDVLWAAMDAEEADGFRPDRLTVLLTGGSAGGYGAAYNYHYVLDDLRWVHTTDAPDAGMGMDTGSLVGVIGLANNIAFPDAPVGWNVRAYLPPYCFAPTCAEVFTNLEIAQEPRLKRTPEQQILNITNQIDTVQVSTTFFPSTAAWVNALRTRYCNIQGDTGIRNFSSAESTSIHTLLTGTTYDDIDINGTLLRDWLGGAFTNPNGVVDLVDDGSLEVDYPGVSPFPCTVN